MDSTAGRSDTVRLEIDRLSSHFESAWRLGHGPRIEQYLTRFEGSDLAKQQLFSRLLGIEIQLRTRAGEQPQELPYEQRFPRYVSAISDLFADQAATDTWSRKDAAWGTGERRCDAPVDGRDDSQLLEDKSAPINIGKYRVINKLGEGKYGVVYLAWHPDLQKEVAIKCSRLDTRSDKSDIERFILEARSVASLKHSSIVTIHDVDKDGDRPFIVQEYISGRDLRETLRRQTIPAQRVAELLADVAEAVAHAHEKGLYHRDLKPSNILSDSEGGVYVTDFGLAMHEDTRIDRRGEKCGTPRYMAPEQVRGESHRLDGRCDIWSLGVILYEMLAGTAPFTARLVDDLEEQILYSEPRPPRQIRPELPSELERICLRCLSKKMSDRYATARDVAADLRAWAASSSAAPSTPTQPQKTVIPRGLRSFQEQDADFYLELVPGPRDREGLPVVVRDWKDRIEEMDPDRTFSIGVLYGPSGSGKSSLLRAGLLPRLSSSILTLNVEATTESIEARIWRELNKRIPAVPSDLSLPEAFVGLRNQQWAIPARKTLLVVDQFEQWLHNTSQYEKSPFLHALRQCDGSHLQAMILVRDDFWMGVTQLLRELEASHCYTAAVDHFDLRHARNVLTKFGQAYGVLPEDPAHITAEQFEFLDQSVHELSENDRVACVHLSVFADMIKDRPWTPATLKRAGGARGIGESFLDAALCSATAAPKHRLYALPAQKVLEQLLPEAGINIKGHTRSRLELQIAAELVGREREFGELLTILDCELHLITPTDPHAVDRESTRESDHSYQLTHDYLIPSLRNWLYRQQRQTRAGRARIRLVERTALWKNLSEQKQLPSLFEWFSIRAITQTCLWSSDQARMMRAADLHHLLRILAVLTLIIGALAGGWLIDSRFRRREQLQRVDGLVQQLWQADTEHLPEVINQLNQGLDTWRPAASEVAHDLSRPIDVRTRAHLALARANRPSAMFLQDRLPLSEEDEYQVIAQELARWNADVMPALWQMLLQDKSEPGARLRIASFLADHDRQNENWRRVAGEVVVELLASDPLELRAWATRVYPVRRQILGPLLSAYKDQSLPKQERHLAASIVADFSSRDVELLPTRGLVELAIEADSDQFEIMFQRLLKLDRITLTQQMLEHLQTTSQGDGADDEFAIHRKANAAEVLLRSGQEQMVWPLLKQSKDPRVRTSLISRIHRSEVDWADALATVSDPSIRQGILLGCEYVIEDMTKHEMDTFTRLLLDLFTTDPDPGVHSAAEWLLKRCGHIQLVADVRDKRLIGGFESEKRRWFVNRHGQTMMVIRPEPSSVPVGASLDLFGAQPPGSPPAADVSFEPLRDVTIDYRFAIGAHEVTVEQYLQFKKGFEYDNATSPELRCPINQISWYDAAKYCRWLSEQEGIEGELCYPTIEEIGPSMNLPKDYYRKKGYRLPTAFEWEHAVRGRTHTSRFFGNSVSELPRYSWFGTNSNERMWPVGMKAPNCFGLFDIYGNIREWCDVLSPSDVAHDGDIDEVVRGGSYRNTASFLRSAGPGPQGRKQKFSTNGFRLAITLD